MKYIPKKLQKYIDLMDSMAACDSRVNMISSTLHTNAKTVHGNSH